MLIALGCTENIAARTVADADIAAIAHLPAIGTHMRPNPELVLLQRPDLVLQMSGRGEATMQTENLRKLGLPVLCFELNSFDRLFALMLQLGGILERESEAAALVSDWKKRLAALPVPERRPAIYYEVREPDLLAAGSANIVNDIIAAAGGKNIVTSPRKLVRFNEEALLLADPDYCLVQQGPMSPAPRPLSRRPSLASLRCSQEGHSLIVDEREFGRPGPGSIRAAEKLSALINGEGRQ